MIVFNRLPHRQESVNDYKHSQTKNTGNIMVNTTSFLHLIFSFKRCLQLLVLIHLLHVLPAASEDISHPDKSDVAEISEVIKIDDTDYEIPPPWKGNKIKDPKLTFPSFSQIPLKYCHNNTKLYVFNKAHPQLVQMLSQAEKDGIFIQAESAYRSTSYQKKIFKRMISEGRKFEDIIRYVAPPGYSEHMLGTAIDFYPSNWRFADTPQHKWLQDNAERFGFKNTYSEFNLLKMPWEAWHWNYILSP